jgi:nucleotide-binding universal stress UspA family protein
MSIVVGYVDREDGRAALRSAIEEAERRSLPLRIIHVVKVGPGGETGESVLESRKALEDLEQDLRAKGVDCEAREVLSSGHPSEAFLEAAAGAELIVIGLRSRSAVGKLIMGSVAQDVLISAPCPVLAVKS